jgi:four helix bundle protein
MAEGDGNINSFRDLRVWQSGMDAAELVLAACDEGPLSKKYRLAGQLEAAAASVPANIAEGHASGSTKVYLKHLYIARGSMAETLTFLELVARRRYIARPRMAEISDVMTATAKMLNSLIGALERKPTKGRKKTPQTPGPKPQAPRPEGVHALS